MDIGGLDNLERVNIKNGIISEIKQVAIYSPALKYICADPEEIEAVVYSFDTNFSIKGQAQIDDNKNGCETETRGYPGLIFDVYKDNIKIGNYSSTIAGQLDFALSEGNYILKPQIDKAFYTISPTTLDVNFPQDGTTVEQDFCIVPKGDINDVEVSLVPTNEARPYRSTIFKIVLENNGDVPAFGKIKLEFDDNYMDHHVTKPYRDAYETGQLFWEYSQVKPGEVVEYYCEMFLNSPTDEDYPLKGGEVLNYKVSAIPVSTIVDETPKNNEFTFAQTVVNSHDPNDKVCLQGKSITIDEVGDYAYYVIRFENVGTASAIDVVVKDELDVSKFDIASLKVTSASHDYETVVTDNVVEFKFDDINLPYQDYANDGYISFKVKTKPNLKEGDSFSNTAKIYFDFNAPIITNTYTTTIAPELSTKDFDDSITKLYPNPVSNQLNISSKKDILSIRLLDITGKELQTTATFAVKNTTLNLNHLKRDVYFVNVKTENGVTTHKVVKK